MEERCIIDSFIVDVPVARRTLFNCAEGSVGVLKRTRAEKKKTEDDSGMYKTILPKLLASWRPSMETC